MVKPEFLPVLHYVVHYRIPIGEVILTTLKACLYYTTFAGVLPEKWYSASGSTPVLNKYGPVPLLQEHSHKSGIVLPGVLLNKLKLYYGSDLDMICNLDILLPLDTLGALSVHFTMGVILT